jgi:dihydroceramidase
LTSPTPLFGNPGQYWGPTTSTVDWCETNYQVTPYVAEFFNTSSSLALALIGLLGMWLHPWAERRFHMAFFAIFIVGLGSVAFHGTLQKHWQAMDEVPMLYTAFAFVYITLTQRYHLKASTRYMLAISLISHALITTYLVTAFDGQLQFTLFHISFGTAEVYSLYQMFQLYLEYKKNGKSTDLTTIFERGFVLYISAFFFWFADMLGCEYINPSYTATAFLPLNSLTIFITQFHGLWHVFVSMGTYNLALYSLYYRMLTTFSNRQPTVAWVLYVIPYIRIVSMKQKNEMDEKERLTSATYGTM